MNAIRKGPRMEVYKGDPKRLILRRWYVREVAGNNEITGDGQGYGRRRSAIIAAIKKARGLPVYVEDRRGNWRLERAGTG